MLTVIVGGYFNAFITFPSISMMYPKLVYSIVGLYSHSYGICIKAFMAINIQEFCQMSNQWLVIVYTYYICKYYNSDISIIMYYRLVLFEGFVACLN